jgi:hypothetical protein
MTITSPSGRLAAACASSLLFVSSSALAAATTVREPAWGLPHIYADTNLELAHENGYQIAGDRLAQMILISRAGRGTLAQAFGLLDPGFLDTDIETRIAGYTSSEYQSMFEKLPADAQAYLVAYCDGVNDRIDEYFAGAATQLPLEVTVLSGLPLANLADDLFGNASNISDQVDPFYKAPGGADPQRPDGGYQFTPEMALAIGVIQVRNFGLNTFEEEDRLVELLNLQATQGAMPGEELFHDYNFLVDPLAPVSVPDPVAPGYGGPLALADTEAQLVADAKTLASMVTSLGRWKGKDWKTSADQISERASRREEHLKKWSAWPKLGSYAWAISSDRSATNAPWIGGFPQTGIETPSLMHYVENRSGEGIAGNGMEFVGAPYVLIGHTDTVAYTTTTAQLRIIDTFFEQVVAEDNDNVRYNDEGTPAAMSKRSEIIIVGGVPPTPVPKVFWRTHERGGNGGSRSVLDFVADAEGTAESGTITTLVDNTASFGPGLIGGHVLITDGAGAGQIRAISNAAGTTLTVSTPFTTTPGATSVYVASASGSDITAVAYDSGAWLEESTTAYAFSLFQRATDVGDIREAVRLIPSTHNFLAADNQAFNGTGTASSFGNIAYHSSGYSRKRQNGQDKLLPIDGTLANPLVVASGTVDSATGTSITDAAASFGDFSPDPVNHRYENPGDQGQEFVLAIISGTGGRQSRRIASSAANSVTIEYPFGVTPAAGDHYEIYEIVGMPEAVNPSEGYLANWNNKASNSDDGDNFGREHRVTFILERLAADSDWTRDDQRQLNKDLGGVDGRGILGRQIVPRIREAVTAEGDGGNVQVEPVLQALEAHNASPDFGRYFNDPVTATTTAGEIAFLNTFINNLAVAIYGDEYAGAIGVPTGARALALVTHAIDSAAGTPAGHYTQEFSGDYFGGTPWTQVVRDTFSVLATGGIPADGARPNSTYNHPLSSLNSALSFEPTPQGNRGTWEQIVEAGSTVKGEFMFPLGQSGYMTGTFSLVPSLVVTSMDQNISSLQPIWRDWRFLPMLHVAETIEGGSETGDADGDGVLDGFEAWYFGDNSVSSKDNADGDDSKLIEEFKAGSDPTDVDTDDDGLIDGFDGRDQDRLASGFTKLSAQFKLKFSDDTFKISSKFGTGTTEFDPATDAIDVRVETADGTAAYEVTIPAGTLVADGTKYSYKDPDGSVNSLASVQLKLGSASDKLAGFKLKTIKNNIPGVPSAGDRTYQLIVTIHDASASSSRTLLDARLWTANNGKIKGVKEPGQPIYH